MGTLGRKVLSPFSLIAPADVEDGSGIWNAGFVGGLQEAVQFPGVRGVGQLCGVVEQPVERLVPGKGREQHQGRLRVRGLPAETVRELSLQIGEDEGEVLDGGAEKPDVILKHFN